MHEIGKLALVTPTAQNILDSLLLEFETQSEMHRQNYSHAFQKIKSMIEHFKLHPATHQTISANLQEAQNTSK